jgi:FkbM family methyltransferase
MQNSNDIEDIEKAFAPVRLEAEKQRIFDIKENIKSGALLFGAGNNGKYAARESRNRNLQDFIGFIDDTPEKEGLSIEGLSVLTREKALSKFGKDIPVVVSVIKAGISFETIKESLIRSGFQNIIYFPDYVRAKDHQIPFFYFSSTRFLSENRDKILRTHDKLRDRKSRDVLKSWISFRLFHNHSLLSHIDDDIYFPDILPGQNDEHFCMADCGAYDGDSIERMLLWRKGTISQAIGFEPDANNAKRLRDRLERFRKNRQLDLRIVEAAVGEKPGWVRFIETSDESAHVVAEGGREVAVVSVDDGREDWLPDYVKYDVEGYELQALKGTRHLIEQHGPSLAISIYHRPEDLWELPEAILSWNPDYKLYLRSHAEEGMDTVLYAIPK